MKRIYLDYAATTPVAPEVERAMKPYFRKVFGNPGSTHFVGQQASAAVFKARQIIARALGCDYQEIIFTGSATESNNLALRGVFGSFGFNSGHSGRLKLIISGIEHESILETARDLEKQGVEVVYLPVNKDGLVDLKKLEAALDERVALVSIQYANSEIGTIQPIKEIVSIIKSQKSNVLVHCDAVQALQFLPCQVNELGVDLMTLSAHKIYGPKGIGALYVRSLNPKPYPPNPIITGGGQEFGLRSGTENVPAIVGFARAVELISNSRLRPSVAKALAGRQGFGGQARELENKKIVGLRNYLWLEIKKLVPEAKINGVDLTDRLPNNLNIYFPGRPAQDLTMELDLWGVAVSPGTACSARSARPSAVIQALGYDQERAKSSLRFTLGRPTFKKEIDQVLTIFKKRFTS